MDQTIRIYDHLSHQSSKFAISEAANLGHNKHFFPPKNTFPILSIFHLVSWAHSFFFFNFLNNPESAPPVRKCFLQHPGAVATSPCSAISISVSVLTVLALPLYNTHTLT